MKTRIAIVDDHELMAKALSSLVQRFEDYEVIFEASGGEDLMRWLDLKITPDIVLLDINMPGMDGYEVARWLREHHPQIRIMALSMYDKEEAIVKMLRNGAKGYLLKGCKPHEFKEALDSMTSKGHYYSEHMTTQLIRNLNPALGGMAENQPEFNEREKAFMQYSCSDLTYVEIADKMCVSPRTVDGYREAVFAKMDVKSRVGMVLKAIKMNLVEL